MAFPLSPILIVAILLRIISSHSANSCYTSIVSVGDSITDTGNLLLSLGGKPNNVANLPYGQTYFHRPTGRFSDGRIILDFIAEELGKPLVPPFLGRPDCHLDFESGVNFAVGGATALDSSFFREEGMDVTWTNDSLSVQMEWFGQVRKSLCASRSDCEDILSRTLFVLGEIGGNDYNHPFFQGRSLTELRASVPKIIQAISSAINDLVDLGARTLLVPGNFPIGCMPAYLSRFQNSSNEGYYDANTGCINWLNEFSEYHNRMLLEELDRIRSRHPYATVIYADYYNAALSIYSSSDPFGFGFPPRGACCGSGGGPYNYVASALCGTETARACSDPARYISWDGMHFTEAAYRIMASGLLNGSYTVPPMNRACPHLEPLSMNQDQQKLDALHMNEIIYSALR